MREVLSCSVTPMLLGNNKCSRRLARRLFWRLGMRSSIFDPFGSPELDMMLSASFTPIPITADDEFIILGLERFAAENDDMTCLLIPCSREFDRLIARNRSRLEARFIIRSPQDVARSTRFGSKAPYSTKGMSINENDC